MVSGARPDLITRRQRDCGLRAMVRPAASARWTRGRTRPRWNHRAEPAGHFPADQVMNSTLGPGEALGDGEQRGKFVAAHPAALLDHIAVNLRHHGVGAADGHQRNQ